MSTSKEHRTPPADEAPADAAEPGAAAPANGPAGGQGAPDAPPPDPAELEAARREAEEQREAAMRARAELENVRKRGERELENAHRYGLERFVSELLPVRDSLALGLAAAEADDAERERIREGIALTLKMFDQACAKFGVQEVDPAGERFDPELHQAMSMQEAPDAESGTVVSVVQKGYVLNERLVRPAMVIVAK